MELIDQRTKRIMEECKERAKSAGLSFCDESLEYIVTNKDLLRLTPKIMLPTLYDYWVHDVEVLQAEGKYKLFPVNPYETVINSRPAISFYNDNNPDWLNIMIFYHVIAHIDFFQNNILFKHTWKDDFVGVALADKRLIEALRSKYGRWCDYIIEFARSIDNIVGYFAHISRHLYPPDMDADEKLMFFFNIFLQEFVNPSMNEITKYKDLYNAYTDKHGDTGKNMFFSEVRIKYPEFESLFFKQIGSDEQPEDILMFISEYSPFLKREENKWMKQILTIIRNTALFFAPQIRTKILNEGWASYWHDKLFMTDKRIQGHETDYARVNAFVTSVNRIGLNPYSIGLRLFQHIENLADKGKFSYNFQKITNAHQRLEFDNNHKQGKSIIFEIRKYFTDFNLINLLITQDFINENNLFVVGKRFAHNTDTIEYYIKSRKVDDYKKMLIDNLYHPPFIRACSAQTSEKNLYLIHKFEGKQLIKEFIPEVLIGLEFLWGAQVQLETSDLHIIRDEKNPEYTELQRKRVLYTCKNKKVTKTEL